MTSTHLTSLTESERDLDPALDLRGRAVVDVDGKDVGDVVDVLLDDDGGGPRLLAVSTPEFPGSGEVTYLVPIDAVFSTNEALIRMRTTSEAVAGGPRFDPDDGLSEQHLAAVYGHYGLSREP